jgi:hypothetical protein
MASTRLAVIALAVAACGGAGGMQMVSQARYQKVPASERATIEASRADELKTAQAVEARASTDLAAARQQAASPQAIRAQAPSAKDKAALAKVDRARQAWLAAGVTWRARRLEAAQLHVVALECARELERAEAIDAHTSDDETYDTRGFRDQHGHAQEAWYVAEAKAVDARKLFDKAAEALSDAKGEYAAVVRDELETDQLAAVADAPMTPHPMW